jgi:adenosylhomocysteine nucleosidase
MGNRLRARGPVGDVATEPVTFLVCFAVKEEAKFFIPQQSRSGSVQAWVTGMGRRNAAESLREAVAAVEPECVLTCGFAGGLNPGLPLGAVLFDHDFDAGVEKTLLEIGAIPAKFHCSKRVAITAKEKAELWQSTGADAVEMESSVIRTLCHEWKIPSATLRVISDTAHEDLPLDFNTLMTSDDRIHFGKLALAVLGSPGKIPKLITFQRETLTAAKELGRVLNELFAQPLDR